ncbi:hypothetical protein [Hyalangium sp.]|uniref:hypothetical protein n=1 Tax=Hyalangium sp. TaxID=2028555 RepID=UPI002D7310E4|nr:hypothetical protein [Hyalangium sp.]HYH94510.1 hypothetical protein [Hyalangium sp.]
MKRFLLLAVAALAASACDDDPQPPDNPDSGMPAVCSNAPNVPENLSSCQPAETDYRPREPEANEAASDKWTACISDDNTYHPIDPNISTVARVAAFEEIATQLWRNGKVPTQTDFVSALDKYTQPEGLASRVQRREDYHYPPAPGGAQCRNAGVPETAPDRCVGPAKLLPILNDAFTRGGQGEAPRLHAARIEAALLWFLYISAYSEVNTCTTTPKDCDSAWAYYTGGTERCAPKGLAGYVQAVAPQTHERAYDATLAVRCWRNLDNETGAAANTALRDQALVQLDRATVRGVAIVLRERFAQLSQGSAEEQQARMAFIQTLAPFLDREARVRNASHADTLKAQAAKATAAEVDAAAATAALDALFSCP